MLGGAKRRCCFLHLSLRLGSPRFPGQASEGVEKLDTVHDFKAAGQNWTRRLGKNRKAVGEKCRIKERSVRSVPIVAVI